MSFNVSLLLRPLVEQARAWAEAEAERDEDQVRADKAKAVEPKDADQVREVKAREAEPGAKVLDKVDVEEGREVNELWCFDNSQLEDKNLFSIKSRPCRQFPGRILRRWSCGWAV